MTIFPLNALVQLYNLSLIQEAGKGVATSVALELDRRARNVMALELDKQAKTALFGAANADSMEVGALFKQALLDGINKKAYDFGDITKNLLASFESCETPKTNWSGRPQERSHGLGSQVGKGTRGSGPGAQRKYRRGRVIIL
ncbi:hypothetical protein SEMRO_283_G107830.1 [Seminavis robusta]|uniref:Uncharacterized protein n=1 Tax=Seminavis robusta TaxID=568900 RepID=A0A9N8DQJ9_9STRA|nr:hypothetical protein SEMRO_283_G107830.1 [Seminavis robusta]|eukprot:Sro283_g107830.1 n/a (143) ;mRNA; f:71604-72032